MSHARHRFWKCHKTLTFLLTFDKVHNPLRLPRKTTSERPKVLRTPRFFALLTSKCASHHNGVHFFDIATSKSAPKLRCFAHFDFEMCFAPQWRALFRHLKFQECSEPVRFLHFWLWNVLRATTACNFSPLIWPAGSTPAALASLLFDPPDPQIIGKTQCFATFLPFRAPASSFFFSSLLFSDSSHLCFSSVHIVGSLTSKLPSVIQYTYIPWFMILTLYSSHYWISQYICHYSYIYIYIIIIIISNNNNNNNDNSSNNRFHYYPTIG